MSSCQDCVRLYEPFKNMSSDSEPFVMPNLPGEIKMTGAQVPYFLKENIDNDLTQLMKRAQESGIVVNRARTCLCRLLHKGLGEEGMAYWSSFTVQQGQ
ncbi:scopoletin glucosyltransferase-like [Prunus yedoensis var. nudiflora]|uniref:Scopoletin glucosyltransferase-like n=1 Tax=Prunus yedoensis var. nudiflora TaxID=2094558 RepID=A0A314URM5_PRUYE|nr:scopoletin glucosyltransferase-like [Prunus yedoensis var. nudiflora]